MAKAGRSQTKLDAEKLGNPTAASGVSVSMATSSTKKWKPDDAEDTPAEQPEKKRRVDVRCELCERKPEDLFANLVGSRGGKRGV